jgi:hypothetical protein
MPRRRVLYLALALFGLVLTAVKPAPLLAAAAPALAAAPPLQWVTGTVGQILVQPKEKYYVFSLQSDDGTTTFVRFCDPETGAQGAMTASSLDYDLLKEAYFRGLRIQVGVRGFGYDSQAGAQKNCLDRVSLYK